MSFCYVISSETTMGCSIGRIPLKFILFFSHYTEPFSVGFILFKPFYLMCVYLYVVKTYSAYIDCSYTTLVVTCKHHVSLDYDIYLIVSRPGGGLKQMVQYNTT